MYILLSNSQYNYAESSFRIFPRCPPCVDILFSLWVIVPAKLHRITPEIKRCEALLKLTMTLGFLISRIPFKPWRTCIHYTYIFIHCYFSYIS